MTNGRGKFGNDKPDEGEWWVEAHQNREVKESTDLAEEMGDQKKHSSDAFLSRLRTPQSSEEQDWVHKEEQGRLSGLSTL